MTDQEKMWLDNLKAGDEVIASSLYDRRGVLVKVSRTTHSQIILERGITIRFWRKTGRIVGEGSGWLVQPEVTK